MTQPPTPPPPRPAPLAVGPDELYKVVYEELKRIARYHLRVAEAKDANAPLLEGS